MTVFLDAVCWQKAKRCFTNDSFYITKVAMNSQDFEWDGAKNRLNEAKHGVSFYEAQYAFADPMRIITEDLDHSEAEKRYFCFGNIHGNILTVRFVMRENKIRIIGAGYWRKGKQIYEKANNIH